MPKGPGKSYRKGMTIIQLLDMFPDEETAKKWLEQIRWPDGPVCPTCGSVNYGETPSHRSMDYRCRGCRKYFSVRKGTVLEASKVTLRNWVVAVYAAAASLKGVSSMELHRELGITQKTAWFLMQRIREFFASDSEFFDGPVEIDESFFGGKEGNKHKKKKLRAGRGTVGKVAVVGAKDRETNRVAARVIKAVVPFHLSAFASRTIRVDSTFTYENPAYNALEGRYKRFSVNHKDGEFVRGKVHINGIESFWAVFKRAYKGTYHKISRKHLHRYLNEFVGRHNIRPMNTIDQMAAIVRGLDQKRLKYANLIA